jgi:hypothetical protein
MCLERDEIFFVGRQAATGGDHRFRPRNQLFDDLLFPLAESCLAIPREDFRDLLSRPNFDVVVSVDIGETQVTGDELGDRRLARAHKTDQGNVFGPTRSVHQDDLTDSEAKRTLISWTTALS